MEAAGDGRDEKLAGHGKDANTRAPRVWYGVVFFLFFWPLYVYIYMGLLRWCETYMLVSLTEPRGLR